MRVARARAPRGMGPFSTAASFSHVEIRSHIHLGSHELLLSVHSLPLGGRRLAAPGPFQDSAIMPPAACAPTPRWRYDGCDLSRYRHAPETRRSNRCRVDSAATA